MSEESKLVTVSWPHHHQVLLEGVWNSFVENFKVDIEVTCNGQHIRAHQLVLGIFCPALKDCMLERQLNLDHAALQGEDMDLVFQFIYRGKVVLAEDRLEQLHRAAKVLGVLGLEEAIDHCRSLASSAAANTAAANRRKRKSTPVKLTKKGYESKRDEAVPPQEGEPVAKAPGGDWTPDEAASESGEESGSDRSAADDRDWGEEEEEEQPSPGASGTEAGRKGEDEEEEEEEEEGVGGGGTPRARAARTQYKKMWRQSQPLQKCSYCAYETRDKDSFKSHIAKHDPNAERHVCAFCSKTFRSKRGFARHQNAHTNPECLLKCPNCEFHSPQKSSLVQHLAAVHKVDAQGNPITGKFRCGECDYACLFECQLKLHVLRKHETERPFKCAECSYGAVLKTDLDKHVSIRHRNERPYMCEVCGFRSQSQGGHNRHRRSHTGEKPFACDVCGKMYADSRKFKIHLKRHEHDEKPFVCHLCGHACRRKDNLKMHLKRIHKTAADVVKLERPDLAAGPSPDSVAFYLYSAASRVSNDDHDDCPA